MLIVVVARGKNNIGIRILFAEILSNITDFPSGAWLLRALDAPYLHQTSTKFQVEWLKSIVVIIPA